MRDVNHGVWMHESWRMNARIMTYECTNHDVCECETFILMHINVRPESWPIRKQGLNHATYESLAWIMPHMKAILESYHIWKRGLNHLAYEFETWVRLFAKLLNADHITSHRCVESFKKRFIERDHVTVWLFIHMWVYTKSSYIWIRSPSWSWPPLIWPRSNWWPGYASEYLSLDRTFG